MFILVITPAQEFLFWTIMVSVLLALGFFTWFSWRMTWKQIDVSPYSGLPLRYGRDIGYYKSEQVYKYLFNMKQYDNRMFDLRYASFCRETGRIFPDSVNWLDSIRVDWSFLQKRLTGNYVSWGSLTEDQKKEVRKRHDSLKEFQTEISSPSPNPRMGEPEFFFTKPGPLYVDISTGTLVGWQEVPGTEFEVLIVQKPTRVIIQKPS